MENTGTLLTFSLFHFELALGRGGAGRRHGGLAVVSPRSPVTLPWPGPPGMGAAASLPLTLHLHTAEKTCPPLYGFQNASKNRQRDRCQDGPCDVTGKGGLWEESTQEKPADDDQPGPGRNRSHSRVCAEPPLSTLSPSSPGGLVLLPVCLAWGPRWPPHPTPPGPNGHCRPVSHSQNYQVLGLGFRKESHLPEASQREGGKPGLWSDGAWISLMGLL